MTTSTPVAAASTAAPVTTSTAAAMTAPAAAAPVAAPVAAPTTETVNPGAWMAGFNDDLKGYVGNKGFKDPGALADAYRNLEKLHGVPQDRLLKLPESFYDDKGALTTEGRGIYEKLGAPKDAKDYGLQVPAEGGDPKLMEHFTKIFHEAGIPKAAAQKIVAEWNGFQGQAMAQIKEAQAAEFNNQDQSLKKEWGAAFDQNRSIAAEGMRKMGMDNTKVDALSSVLGHAETMKLLCNIGKATGEGSFVMGKRQDGPVEPNVAITRINELKGDKDFGARLMNGDADARATWDRLHSQAYQGSVNI